jgi:putative peptidoglycan lipid II flippase
MMQNLLGEGVLSASFIPVYARLRAEGRDREASELAEAIFALLAMLASVIVALGVLGAPLLVTLLGPGFQGEERELIIALVRIVFPGTGLLVFAAWCLGVLNSHGRFFLSYASGVMMNLAIIAALLWQGGLRGQGTVRCRPQPFIPTCAHCVDTLIYELFMWLRSLRRSSLCLSAAECSRFQALLT